MTYPLHPGQPGTPLRRHVEARHLVIGDVAAEYQARIVRIVASTHEPGMLYVFLANGEATTLREHERVWVLR